MKLVYNVDKTKVFEPYSFEQMTVSVKNSRNIEVNQKGNLFYISYQLHVDRKYPEYITIFSKVEDKLKKLVETINHSSFPNAQRDYVRDKKYDYSHEGFMIDVIALQKNSFEKNSKYFEELYYYYVLTNKKVNWDRSFGETFISLEKYTEIQSNFDELYKFFENPKISLILNLDKTNFFILNDLSLVYDFYKSIKPRFEDYYLESIKV